MSISCLKFLSKPNIKAHVISAAGLGLISVPQTIILFFLAVSKSMALFLIPEVIIYFNFGRAFINDFVIGVLNVNEAPLVNTNFEPQLVNEDSPLSFTIPDSVFLDPESGSLTFTASLEDGSALPEWLTFDPETKQFSGTPRNNDVGTYSIKVTVSDGDYSVSDVLNITVNNTYDATISGDIIDVGGLLTSLNYTGSDPFADGWLALEQSGSDTLLKLAKSGSGSTYDTTILSLTGITSTELTRENFSFNSDPKILGQTQDAVFHANLTSDASHTPLEADPIMGSYYSETLEGTDEDDYFDNDSDYDDQSNNDDGDINVEDYLSDDDTPDYKLKSNNYSDDDEEKSLPFVSGISFNQFLKNQLATFSLKGDDQKIAEFLVGSVDQSGYIRADLLDIVDDLAFTMGVYTNSESCLLYTSPSPRDKRQSRMPSSA